MDYDKIYFGEYINNIICELDKRKIKYNEKLKFEIYDFCCNDIQNIFKIVNNYPEHNDRYLKQCYYNLQEKYDRGIITEEEWQKIYNNFKDFTDLWI